MNCQTYIFGKLPSGYTAYPDDYAADIFREFAKRVYADGQITVHRDGSLMYYGYVRRLGTPGEYIAFCILLNDAMFAHPTALFPVFENLVAEAAERGKILTLSDSGSLTAATGALADQLPEAERMAQALKRAVQPLERDVEKLPPVSYATGTHETKDFAADDDDEPIAEATARYSYTCIYKFKKNDTANLAGYRAVLNRVNQRNVELERKNRTLTRQKKQLRLVAVLAVIAVVFIGATIGIQNTLNETREDLSSTKDKLYNTESDLETAKHEIEVKNEMIDSLNTVKNRLQSQLSSKETELTKTKADLASKKAEVSRLQNKVWEYQQELPRYLW
ncbi:MAG: hypothetical protein J6M53_08870 [Bacteroidaceae bacterium]|nr:hypothetical protein [Bacteroidaceae bacterium]